LGKVSVGSVEVAKIYLRTSGRTRKLVLNAAPF